MLAVEVEHPRAALASGVAAFEQTFEVAGVEGVVVDIAGGEELGRPSDLCQCRVSPAAEEGELSLDDGEVRSVLAGCGALRRGDKPSEDDSKG